MGKRCCWLLSGEAADMMGEGRQGSGDGEGDGWAL